MYVCSHRRRSFVPCGLKFSPMPCICQFVNNSSSVVGVNPWRRAMFFAVLLFSSVSPAVSNCTVPRGVKMKTLYQKGGKLRCARICPGSICFSMHRAMYCIAASLRRTHAKGVIAALLNLGVVCHDCMLACPRRVIVGSSNICEATCNLKSGLEGIRATPGLLRKCLW